jgi:hypothetical protein
MAHIGYQRLVSKDKGLERPLKQRHSLLKTSLTKT